MQLLKDEKSKKIVPLLNLCAQNDITRKGEHLAFLHRHDKDGGKGVNGSIFVIFP